MLNGMGGCALGVVASVPLPAPGPGPAAGRGLNENLALVPAALGIKVAGLAVLIYMFAALCSAFNVGRPARNSLAVRVDGEEATAICLDAYNQS